MNERLRTMLPILCLGCLLSTSPTFAQPERETLNAAVIEPQIGKRLPLDAAFVDHAGSRVSLSQIADGRRPTIICLVYFECPMLCKLSADGLVRAVAAIRADVGDAFNVAIISFDPRDRPEQAAAARTQALRQYARDDSGKGWYFLTGRQSAIDQVADAIGFRYVWDEETKQFSHAAGLVIVSPGGVITQYLDGVRFSPDQLRTAIEQSDNDRLASDDELTFARCYLYNPTTGRFGSAVQWTVRVLGLVTVVGIVLSIVRLRTQEIGCDRDRVDNGVIESD